jgi:hypothetical protein
MPLAVLVLDGKDSMAGVLVLAADRCDLQPRNVFERFNPLFVS